jgi:two-component system, NarL family, nitrate/nitrite response regulator NarL
MNAAIFTSIRLLGDGLSRYLSGKQDICVLGVFDSIPALRALLAESQVDVVLVDMTQDLDLDDVRSIAVEAPDVVLIALGLREQRQEVIRCGRAGFSGYVARDATVDVVAKTLRDALAGRLACPAEISNGLLRALFRADPSPVEPAGRPPLTAKERVVLQLMSRGLTNKEIARELTLSIATVKAHVHKVLEKLDVPRRSYAMQRVRERPWIAS